MRDRRTLPSRQHTYRRLHARVDQLDDAISHFYNAINELRSRVSTLEKKLEPLAKDVVAEAGPMVRRRQKTA
jgi:prefoldin subunit 5